MVPDDLLRRETLTAELLDPGEGFALAQSEVEVRWDPLTGHTSRLVEAARLLPPSDFDLTELAARRRAECPFCPEHIEHRTPQLRSDLEAGGRIERGEAMLFPNRVAYAKHSAVSVYGPHRHMLSLGEMTPRLVADNLATQVAFARAVLDADPGSRWSSINANHLLPAGSSVFHPHLQGIVDPFPTTMQRLLVDVPWGRVEAYLAAERALGERHLGSSGRVEWLASFAPLAPGELRAFIPGFVSPVDLDDELVEELAAGIATAVSLYAELGYNSFNLAIYGAPPGTSGYGLNLRLACRSNLASLYRSDATYLERLHWEAAIDLSPEELASHAGDRFAR